MVRHFFPFAPDGNRMSPRNNFENIPRGYKSKHNKRKMSAAWRAAVLRRQANGRLGAHLNEGDYVGFRIKVRDGENILRKLSFGGLIDFVVTPTSFQLTFMGPYFDD